MLAGYNAGPYAVTSAGGVPAITETRNYVRRIRALTASYSTAGANQTVPGSAGQAALVFAYDLLGTPYRWGGNGTAATDGEFDCSGLTQAAYAATGITIPRTAAQQYWAGTHIPVSQLQPGDLVFYATNLSDPGTIHHVGIYAGGGEIIDAPHTGANIRFDPVNEAGLIGATRIAQ